MRKFISFVLISSCFLTLNAEKFIPPIVPWPKTIQFSDSAWTIEDSIDIIVDNQRPEQVDIGAKRLQEKLKKLGVRCEIIDETQVKDSKGNIVIHIGVCGKNNRFDQLLKKYDVNITPENPGEQGYVIRCLEEGGEKTILIAGSDAVGALYGCVTAEQLVIKRDNKTQIAAATIKDWPDIKQRWLGSPRNQGCYGNTNKLFELGDKAPESPEFKKLAEDHVNRMKIYIDWLLTLKINGFDALIKRWGHIWCENIPESVAQISKTISDYAHARGLKNFYYDSTNLIPNDKEKKRFKNQWWKGIKLNNATGRNSKLCWSRDDLVIRKASSIGKYMKKVGIDLVQLHGTDAGNYDDPEIWSQRCAKCREKWGNDKTKASAHLYNLFIKEIKKECPEAEVALTYYPYFIDILSDKSNFHEPYPKCLVAYWKSFEKYLKYKPAVVGYWTGLAKSLPSDTVFTAREAPIDANKDFQKICGEHPIFIFFEMQSWLGWQTEFSTNFRYMKTFYNPTRKKDIVWPSCEGKTLPTFIGAADYSWNTELPGAADWLPVRIKDGNSPESVFKDELPRYCRNTWGDKISHLMTKALSQNICAQYVISPDEAFKAIPESTFEDIALMKKQSEGAAIAAASLLEVLSASETDPNCLSVSRNMKYPIELLLKMSSLHQVAQAYHDYWLIKKYLKEEAYAKATALKKHTLANLEKTPTILKELITMIRTSKGPLRSNISLKSQWPAKALAKCAELKNKIEKIDCKKVIRIWPREAEKTLTDRISCATKANAKLTIDGKVDEEAWQHAIPIEHFVLFKNGFKKPTSQTRFRVLYDDKNIYIGFKAFYPNGKLIAYEPACRDASLWTGQDNVEIFLAPGSKDDPFYQFGTTPKGTIFDSRDRNVKPPFRSAWNCDGLDVKTFIGNGYWSGEMAIPIKSLDTGSLKTGDAWRIMLVRNIGKGGGKLETSSFTPNSKGFLNPNIYSPLVFIGNNLETTSIVPQIESLVLTLKDKVFVNRVTSVVNYSFEVKSETTLHQVVIEAKVFSPAGKMVGEMKPIKLDTIPFHWAIPYPIEIALDQEFDEVKVATGLESLEGKSSRTFSVKKSK